VREATNSSTRFREQAAPQEQRQHKKKKEEKIHRRNGRGERTDPAMRVLGCERPLPREPAEAEPPIWGAMGLLRRGDLGILSCEEGFAGGEGREGRKEVVLCAGFALTDMAFFS
jgi:hypothetical protein